jgi:hypothetical protein
MFTAHHQEVFTVYVQQLVRATRFGDWQLAGSGWKLRINGASSWFHHKEYQDARSVKHKKNLF